MTHTTLKDVSESVRYGYTASATDEEAGPKFLRITDIVPDQINWETVPYCSIADEDREKYNLLPGDIVVARTGATVGYAKLIRQQVESVFASYLVRFRIDKKKAHPGFVGKIIESESYKSFVRGHSGGAAQPNASAPLLGSFSFDLPVEGMQERIFEVISAYDDLIENNRRRIKLLEESARLLYREWFVHLRFPGHEHVKIVEGVPEGWQRLPFSALAEYVNGYPFKPAELFSEGLPVIKIPELRDGATEKTPRNTGEAIPAKYLVQDRDLLFSWSGTLLVNFWHQGRALLNQHLFRVDPLQACGKEFLFFAIDGAMPAFTNQTTGATMKHIRKSALDSVTTLCPDAMLMKQFRDCVEPTFNLIHNLNKTNDGLRQARDLLLPRLMSGDLQIA